MMTRRQLGSLLLAGAVVPSPGLRYLIAPATAAVVTTLSRVALIAADDTRQAFEVLQPYADVLTASGMPVSLAPGIGVLPGFARLSAGGDLAAAVLPANGLAYLRRLGIQTPPARYVARLYQADLSVIAAAAFGAIPQLAGQRVSVGPRGGPAHITASLLFSQIGVRINPVFLSQSGAVQALRRGEIAAAVDLAPSPSPLGHMLSGADQARLLPALPASGVPEGCVPSLVTEPEEWYGRRVQVETIGVPMVLAVYDWPADTAAYALLERAINAWFRMAPRLNGFDPASPVAGWVRFPASASWLASPHQDLAPQSTLPSVTTAPLPAPQPAQPQSPPARAPQAQPSQAPSPQAQSPQALSSQAQPILPPGAVQVPNSQLYPPAAPEPPRPAGMSAAQKDRLFRRFMDWQENQPNKQ